MFQIKTFLGIIASMINRLRATSMVLTDFNVGSNVRVLLEAVSQEVDELYQQMVATLKAAIAQATYISFGFTPLPAVSASGFIQVTIIEQSTVVTVAQGTIFTPVNGGTVTYMATSATPIPVGDTTINVPVIASVAGSAGNIAAATVFSSSTTPTGFVGATNLVAISNGLDPETPSQQYIRFQFFITSLARSTLGGIRYGALSVILTDQYGNVIERVAAVQVFEPYTTNNTLPAWLYQVWIYNGVGASPGASPALVAAVLQQLYGYYDENGNPIDGYKAAGTSLGVFAATINSVGVTAAVTLASGTITNTTVSAIESAWATYLNSLPLGAGFTVSKLVAIAVDTPGVVDCVISLPAANVAGAVGVQIEAGTLAISPTGGE